jgi:hypothetical protein
MKWSSVAKFFIGVCLVALAVVTFQGCAHQVALSHASPHAPLDPTQPGGSLHGVAVSLDWLIGGAILIVGAGVALYFILPAAHSLSIAIGASGLAVEGLAIFTRVVLPYALWIAIALGVIAIGVFAYEVYTNRAVLEADAAAAKAKAGF